MGGFVVMTRFPGGKWKGRSLHEDWSSAVDALASMGSGRRDTVERHLKSGSRAYLTDGNGTVFVALIGQREAVGWPLQLPLVSRYCTPGCDQDPPYGGGLSHYLGHDALGHRMDRCLFREELDLDDLVAMHTTGDLREIKDVRGVGASGLARLDHVVTYGRYYPASPGVEWARRVAALRRQLENQAPLDLGVDGSVARVSRLLHEAELVLMRGGQE